MNRTYICPVETALELIGGKYKTLILWHLAEGTLRFGKLQKIISSATPKMLTKQLRELERDGLIIRKVYPVVPPRVEYSLTELGRSFIPVMQGIRGWGEEYLAAKHMKPNCSMTEHGPCCRTGCEQ